MGWGCGHVMFSLSIYWLLPSPVAWVPHSQLSPLHMSLQFAWEDTSCSAVLCSFIFTQRLLLLLFVMVLHVGSLSSHNIFSRVLILITSVFQNSSSFHLNVAILFCFIFHSCFWFIIFETYLFSHSCPFRWQGCKRHVLNLPHNPYKW